MNHEQQPKPAGAVPPGLPDPSEVLRDTGLTRHQKVEKLLRWRHDAQELEVANDEGMGGHVQPSNLAAIDRALRELGVDS